MGLLGHALARHAGVSYEATSTPCGVSASWYVGEYQLAPTFHIVVTREADGLFIQATGRGAGRNRTDE